MSTTIENATWGTSKTHNIEPGDQVLVLTFKTSNFLTTKNLRKLGEGEMYEWKTVQVLTGSATRRGFIFTDYSTGNVGGVATRYYARKA